MFIFNGNVILKYRPNWNHPDQLKTLLAGLTNSERDAPIDGMLHPKIPPIKQSLPVNFDACNKAAWDAVKKRPHQEYR